jgi:predicted aspartyl protease
MDCCSLFCYKGYLTNIEVGQIQLDDRPYFTTQDSVVFDTGADFSFIPSNNIGFPIFLFLSLVYDGDGNNKILPMYFTQYFEVNDKVKIKNFTYISGFKNNRFKAIIGMNVLSKLNILFLSTQNTLDIKSFDFKPQIPSSAIILQYKDRIRPKVTLRLDNVVIDDILIDTGFDGDLAIDDHYIEKLKSNHSCDSMISTFLTLFDTHTVKNITFSELHINERLYKNIHVVQLKKRRLLGSKFLKRFDKVFWDSKNLTVYMWNENDEY